MSDVRLCGVAVMGQNFALNMVSHGFSVCVRNRSPTKVSLAGNCAKAKGTCPLLDPTMLKIL